MEQSLETRSAEGQTACKGVGASFQYVMYLDRDLLQTVKK